MTYVCLSLSLQESANITEREIEMFYYFMISILQMWKENVNMTFVDVYGRFSMCSKDRCRKLTSDSILKTKTVVHSWSSNAKQESDISCLAPEHKHFFSRFKSSIFHHYHFNSVQIIEHLQINELTRIIDIWKKPNKKQEKSSLKIANGMFHKWKFSNIFSHFCCIFEYSAQFIYFFRYDQKLKRKKKIIWK